MVNEAEVQRLIRYIQQKRVLSGAFSTFTGVVIDRPAYQEEEEEYQTSLTNLMGNHVLKTRELVQKAESVTRLKSGVSKVQKLIDGDFKKMAEIASSHAFKMEENHKEYFNDMVNQALKVDLKTEIDKLDLTETMNQFADRNSKLIRKAQEGHLDAVQSTVKDMINADVFDQQKLIDQLIELDNRPMWQAKLVARDQHIKLLSEFDKQRQLGIGIEEYEWDATHDSRTRPEHRDAENLSRKQPFNWKTGAPNLSGAHPGQPIQCRCRARPIFKDYRKTKKKKEETEKTTENN